MGSWQQYYLIKNLLNRNTIDKLNSLENQLLQFKIFFPDMFEEANRARYIDGKPELWCRGLK
jgi:hypothetical protein